MVDPDTSDKPDDAPSRAVRIALAHDWLCGFRGGEAVLEQIALVARQVGEVDRLYTMFDDGRALSPTVDGLGKTVSPLSALPDGLRRWLFPLYPWAVGRLSSALAHRQRRNPVDLVVSTSSAAIKGLATPDGVPHVCYCHAPARYVWSARGEYATGTSVRDRARALGLAGFGATFRRWDRATASRVTRFLANSTFIASEIERCFDRESEVVHPPVRTRFFTPDPGTVRNEEWLLVSALEPYKRADLAIEAARLAGARLVVVGGGSMERSLRAIAGEGVRFEGRVSDARLRELYRSARVLIYPQREDFGIIAVEAQACGCPVVARRAGGALDSVVEGETGVFFDDPTPEAIARAAAECPEGARTSDACRANALRFGERAFAERMTRIVRASVSSG